MTEDGMPFVGYARVSTVDQATDGHSLAAQKSAIEIECQRRGWNLSGIFADEGKSGKTLDRPALREALTAVASGEATGLAVARLDRLSRSVSDFATLLTWFTDAERTLVALDVGVDSSTPGGRLVASVFSSVAAWEVEVLAARTKDGLRAARDAGRAISRPAVVDHPELADRIKSMRAKGLTLQQIADALNDEKIPTLRGGTTWRPSSFQTVVGPKRRAVKKKAIDLPKATPVSGA